MLRLRDSTDAERCFFTRQKHRRMNSTYNHFSSGKVCAQTKMFGLGRTESSLDLNSLKSLREPESVAETFKGRLEPSRLKQRMNRASISRDRREPGSYRVTHLPSKLCPPLEYLPAYLWKGTMNLRDSVVPGPRQPGLLVTASSFSDVATAIAHSTTSTTLASLRPNPDPSNPR